MSTLTYPVRVDASLEPQLNRWLWLVKWLLVLPHYVVLAFLWLAFAVLSVVAFVAIAITGRYPRQIFDFNVGVLRWSWRVAYYAYGALGTDRYPPFTLAEVPDYPAHLEVPYPEHLSRGLVLVKWWLLAIPHYLVVGIFVGGGIYAAKEATAAQQTPWIWGGGLIGLLVLVAAVVLLFTGRYPRSIFDLVLGLNRWVLRVATYAGLMTDEYPPFRLDMGPDDPGSRRLAMSAPVSPSEAPPAPSPASGSPAPASTGQPPHAPPPASGPSGTWSAGRVVAMVLGCLVFLLGGGLVAGGVTLAVAQGTVKDGTGFYMSGEQSFQTATHAIQSGNLETKIADGAQFVPDRLLGDTKLTITPLDGKAIFVGIGHTKQVQAYLAGVAHTTVVDFSTSAGRGGEPVYRDTSGAAPATAPAEAVPWVAEASGRGTQDVVWSLKDGDWTVLVMNADGSAHVAVDVSAGAQFPAIGWAIAILLSLGGLLLILAAVFIVGALRAGNVKGERP
jgi:Domain of unknown function (DUF4389)